MKEPGPRRIADFDPHQRTPSRRQSHQHTDNNNDNGQRLAFMQMTQIHSLEKEQQKTKNKQTKHIRIVFIKIMKSFILENVRLFIIYLFYSFMSIILMVLLG